MIKVFIDSTAFKSEPFRLSKQFAQIVELSILGYLEIHLSAINVEEIHSWIKETITAQHQSASECLTKAFNFKLSDTHYKHTQAKLNEISNLLESTVNDASTEFSNWLKAARVIVHPIEPTDGNRVMAAYFVGDRPFKHIKHRQDIPDAFIWECLRRFADQKDELYFVSSDNNFREKVINSFININCFDSLKKLFESEGIISLMEKWSAFTKQADNDAVIDLIKYEIKLQKQYINQSFYKILQDHFIGNKVTSFGNTLTGEISDLHLVEEPEISIDYIKVDESSRVYFTFDCETQFNIYIKVPVRNFHRGAIVRDEYFDNISLNETSSDTDYAAEEYKLVRVFGELLLELPKINSSSGKEDVIDAIDEAELILVTLRTDH